MNDYDKNNLMFLLNAPSDVLKQWSKTVTADDLDYAMELLQMYSAELSVREMEMDEMFDEGLGEAQSVLRKIMAM
jgi:alpha-amylase/alpha-mannosidase (GH57 family)